MVGLKVNPECRTTTATKTTRKKIDQLMFLYFRFLFRSTNCLKTHKSYAVRFDDSIQLLLRCSRVRQWKEIDCVINIFGTDESSALLKLEHFAWWLDHLITPNWAAFYASLRHLNVIQLRTFLSFVFVIFSLIHFGSQMQDCYNNCIDVRGSLTHISP